MLVLGLGVFGLSIGPRLVLFKAGVRGVWKTEGYKSEGCESAVVEGVGGEATVVTRGVKSSSSLTHCMAPSTCYP